MSCCVNILGVASVAHIFYAVNGGKVKFNDNTHACHNVTHDSIGTKNSFLFLFCHNSVTYN